MSSGSIKFSSNLQALYFWHHTEIAFVIITIFFRVCEEGGEKKTFKRGHK